MAAKEKKTEAAAAKKPTTRRAMSRMAAAPEITQEMTAERTKGVKRDPRRADVGVLVRLVGAVRGPKSRTQRSRHGGVLG